MKKLIVFLCLVIAGFGQPTPPAAGSLTVNSSTGVITAPVTAALFKSANGIGSGSGTVTAVSVSSSNGFAGSSSGGATPALTLSTTVSGIIKGNGTALSAAVADVDYQVPLTFGLPLSRTVNAISIANAAADGSTKGAASFTATDFDASGGNVSIDYTNGQAAASGVKGFLTASDWATFNGKQSVITFGTGVQAALGVNIGSAGAPVLFNGALGTPISGVGTNLTGTAASLTAGNATRWTTGRTISLTGDVTYTSGSLDGSGNVTGTSTLTNIPTGTPMAGSVLATAIAAPSTPAAGKGSIYVDSTSKNLAVKDDAGVVKHGVQTVPATASQWIRAIDDAGAGTKSQPAFTDISGTATNAMLANMADGTIKGNASGSSAAPSDLTALPLGVLSAPAVTTGTGGSSYGTLTPLTFYVKNVTVLTAGTPADIATIIIPAGIVRWSSAIGIVGNSGGGFKIYAETASGTLGAAQFTLWTAAGGTGSNFSGTTTGPTSAGILNGAQSSAGGVPNTTNTIYIRQATNSANAGTVSFYVTIFPIP